MLAFIGAIIVPLFAGNDLDFMLFKNMFIEEGPEYTTLSDQTVVGDMTWAELKETAMVEDLKLQPWYSKMTMGERHLLSALIKAQEDQGNMQKLESVKYKYNQQDDPI